MARIYPVPMEMLALCALDYANEATGSVTAAFVSFKFVLQPQRNLLFLPNQPLQPKARAYKVCVCVKGQVHMSNLKHIF